MTADRFDEMADDLLVGGRYDDMKAYDKEHADVAAALRAQHKAGQEAMRRVVLEPGQRMTLCVEGGNIGTVLVEVAAAPSTRNLPLEE